MLLRHDGVGFEDYQRRRADDLAAQGYPVSRAGRPWRSRFFGDPDAMLARILPLMADSARMQAVGHAPPSCWPAAALCWNW